MSNEQDRGEDIIKIATEINAGERGFIIAMKVGSHGETHTTMEGGMTANKMSMGEILFGAVQAMDMDMDAAIECLFQIKRKFGEPHIAKKTVTRIPDENVQSPIQRGDL